MERCGQRLLLAAAALLLGSSCAAAQAPSTSRVNTISDVFARLRTCWKPPPAGRVHPIDITVIVSFNRAGDILGHPRITYESAEATDDDRLQYRIAVMEALQRCTPMPFTDAMAGAAAGRPFAVQFHGPKTSPPTQERPV
ncbi:hypothetical protein [Bradyrhizobium sp.]|uniref:hypothetical protein n=1 Tax=Bradyrhizobium sp. TaxID=376 RepID=UPI0039E5E574